MSAIINAIKHIFTFFSDMWGKTLTWVLLLVGALVSPLVGIPQLFFELWKWVNNQVYNLSLVGFRELLTNNGLSTQEHNWSVLSWANSAMDYLIIINYFAPLQEMFKFAFFLVQFAIVLVGVILTIKSFFQLAPTGG